MKRLLILLIVNFISISLLSQTKWDYPIKPGSDQWKNFKTSKQMVEACKIPDDFLTKMTTEELLTAWENYPLKVYVFASNSLQDGFEHQKKISSALNFLFTKKDFGNVVLKRYKEAKVLETQIYANQNPDISVNDYFLLRLLLSQPEVISSLTNDGDKDFVNKEIEVIKRLKKIESSLNIYTPRGTYVSNIIRTDDINDPLEPKPFNPDQVDWDFCYVHPNATLIDHSTRTYNCHSYAWANGYTNRTWINGISPYLPESEGGDGSYDNVSEGSASIVTYTDNHSAITTETQDVYISKWGWGPLMRHAKDDCPDEYGAPNKFYRISVDVPQDQSSIYSAVSAAASGQTVNVSSGSYTSSGSVTVPTGVTLAIQSSAVLNFQSGAALTVNGTLTANGSSSSTSITFDFGSPNSSTQNGIVFNSGSSGTINYCQIRNAYSGIYENNISVDITNSAFSGCTNGIYLYGSSPLIQGCNIHDNANYGINMLYSSPTIKENYLQSNGCGIYCSSSSTPVIGNNSTQIGNNITNNNYGVIVYNNALPTIGNGSSGGYNNFTNPNTNILNATGNTVYAQHNWWGTTDPNNFKITGSVSYSPYLTSSVSVPLPPLNKASVNLAASVNSDDDIPMLSELDKAYQLVASNNLAEARSVCLNLVNNYPDYSVSYNALNLLKETYSSNELSAKKDIYKSLFDNKGKKDLYAMAGLILSDMDKGNKLKQIDEVMASYNKEGVIELALFDKFVYYYFELNDKENAKTISNELDEQFPLSEGAVEAHKILGDEKYYKIDPVRRSNQNSIDQTTTEYSLSNNYPNPFNPSTTISFRLPKMSFVTLKVYDILGREITTLVNGYKDKGYYEVSFDASNLASGVYIYQLKAGGFVSTKKMILTK